MTTTTEVLIATAGFLLLAGFAYLITWVENYSKKESRNDLESRFPLSTNPENEIEEGKINNLETSSCYELFSL